MKTKRSFNLLIASAMLLGMSIIAGRTAAVPVWVPRIPGADEKPENMEFYARDDKDSCSVYYKGTLITSVDSLYLKVYAGTGLYKRLSQKITDGAYSFSPTIAPGLVEYKIEFGSKTGATESSINTVTNIACGDAYIVDGQSNAVAGQWGGNDLNTTTSEWIRSYGNIHATGASSGWFMATHWDGGKVGFWALEVARKLMTNYKIPICIINGALSGARVDEIHRIHHST